MKKKKVFTFTIILFSLINLIFAAENLSSLLETAQKKGMTLYWDSLSESGIIEKNGHQLSFRKDEQIALLDSYLLVITDAPVKQNNQIMVTQKFIDDVENLFKENNQTSFKVGAILIDAGHGGKDPGAFREYTINGKKVLLQEKDVTLKVAQMLNDRLKMSYPDKKIIMTRSGDKYLSLSERTDIANGVKVGENEATLYISIHVNSSFNKTASGYEVWYLTPGTRRTVIDKNSVEEDKNLFPILNSMLEEEYTTESIMIAKFIMDGMTSQIGKESTARGIKAEEWFVVKNSNMPAVLIELGFLTNEKEAKNLMNDTYLKKTTLGIYNGINAFITHFERSKGFTSVK